LNNENAIHGFREFLEEDKSSRKLILEMHNTVFKHFRVPQQSVKGA